MAAAKRAKKPATGERYYQDRYGKKHPVEDAVETTEVEAPQPALPPAN